MKRFAAAVLCAASLFCVALLLADDAGCPIMRPDSETLRRWMEEDLALPEAYYDPAIAPRRGGSFSLLGHLPYVASARQQKQCGNCWTWAGTGCAEIANNVDQGVWKRFSIQYINSCGTNTGGNYCCCGGNLARFAQWYAARGRFIPWSNARASFADASRTCEKGVSAVTCGSIAKTPYYPIRSISAATIPTYGVGQAKAIERIKNSLRQNKAVYFGFFLPDADSWNQFQDFWSNHDETWWFDFSNFKDRQWVDGAGGGHAVLIVGYNEDDDVPYWIVVNSWGTAGGMRPHGIFRAKMEMDYDACYNYSAPGNSMLLFQTLEVELGPAVAWPVKLGTSGTSFSTSASMRIYAAATRRISAPFYPFVRVVTPYYGTYYLTSRYVMYPYPVPYTPYPITVSAPFNGLYLCSLWWQNLGRGTYYLEGGGVSAASPRTPSGGYNYIGPVHRTAFTMR
jgi:hypothetical protein